MSKHQVLLSLSILLITLMAWKPGAAENLATVSLEETLPALCDPGAFISGIRCTGRYCDNKETVSCTGIPSAALRASLFHGFFLRGSGWPEGSVRQTILLPAWHAEAITATTLRFTA